MRHTSETNAVDARSPNSGENVARDVQRPEGDDREMPGYFRHAQAIVESGNVGRGTRVWAFAHILPGAVIGADCNICDGVFVENGAVVGDRVTVKCGVQLWDGVTLEDDVFVGPNATFTNDAFPRSRSRNWKLAPTRVRQGASIGANATVLPGVTVGQFALVGAGAVVTRDVPPHAIVAGNPARVVGFVGADNSRLRAVAADAEPAPLPTLRTAGARLCRLPVRPDERGMLSFGQYGTHFPFTPKRYFLIADVPQGAVRGQHAHRASEEFVVSVHGSCSVVLDDGVTREELLLDSPSVGLYVAPPVWRTMYKYSAGAVTMVLSSITFDESDYVRDYDEFRRLCAAR